jgi:hypothetical protein
MISRVRLLKQSHLQLRGEADAQQIAAGFNTSDLSTTIVQRRKLNRSGGTYVSLRVLDSVDVCSRALPHANKAAKKARGIGESMQHAFGTGSIFLTVSFDDDCCYLTQVLSGVQVDDDVDISTLTEDELKEWCKKCTAIRLDFPGITALNFKMCLQILVEEVVGWDMRKDQRTKKPGYFGICLAFLLSIEEQGRKSLHGHMTAWIEGYKELQRMLFLETGLKRWLVEHTLQKYFDHVGTTELFGTKRSSLHSSFQHDCVVENLNKRELLKVVSDQELRGLCHVCGYKECNGVFAVCEACDKKFTYEELVTKHVTKTCMIPEAKGDGSNYAMTPNGQCVVSTMLTMRMDAEVVIFKKTRDANARYQHHKSCHVRGCFRCKKDNGIVGNMYLDQSVNVVTDYRIRAELTRLSRETVRV